MVALTLALTLTPSQVLRLLLSHGRSTRLARCWRWLLGCCCRHASLLAFVAAVPSPGSTQSGPTLCRGQSRAMCLWAGGGRLC